MADILIKIPDEIVSFVNINGFIPQKYIKDVSIALLESIPLPKGHGDLIYRNEIEYLKAIHDLKWGKITASECATKIIYSAPTIIEADKAETEET